MLDLSLGLVGIILSVLFWFVSKEKFFSFFKKKSIKRFVEKLKLRSELKVAIVDDEINSYPIDYIRNLGFKVNAYESVSYADADTLIKNDLILLDVKGVVKEDLEEGGAKLIKIIKNARPLLPVIAVSSGYFHAELNDYFKSSDATLNKPINEYKILELLNELKREFFDACSIATEIEEAIRKLDIGSSKKNKLNKLIIDLLTDEVEIGHFNNVVHEYAKSDSSNIIDCSKKLLERIKND